MSYEPLLRRAECNRCGHTWEPRSTVGKPVRCASCRSPLWDTARKYRVRRLKPLNLLTVLTALMIVVWCAGCSQLVNVEEPASPFETEKGYHTLTRSIRLYVVRHKETGRRFVVLSGVRNETIVALGKDDQ